MNYATWTYLLRAVGILLLLPSLFYDQFLAWFPGLEDRRVTMVLFVAGVTVFIVAAVAHFVLRRMELRRLDKEDRAADSTDDKV
jgi:hypothetical protein